MAQTSMGLRGRSSSPLSIFTAALLLATFPGTFAAQSVNAGASAAPAATSASHGKEPTGSERRRAAKLYLASSKLFAEERFDEAMSGYEKAAALDPTNPDYGLAIEVARSHVVTALVQAAAKAHLRNNAAEARAALARALQLDPTNLEVTQHLFEMGDDAARDLPRSPFEQQSGSFEGPVQLSAAAGVHSFHLRSDERQILQQVFKAYGIDVTFDDSVRGTRQQLDLDNVGFEEAIRVVSLLTKTFYVPLDAHRALIARDTRDNHQTFARQELETIHLSGLNATELNEVSTLAKNVFDITQVITDASAGTLTLRAPGTALNAFNTIMRDLLDGHSQVLLEVRLIQLAHTNTRKTGVQPPQTMTAFNVYAEEQSILKANASLVEQIVSSGLAAPGDTLAILGILLASGQVTSSIFSNGVALFGGGITESALSPSGAKANFNLGSSDSRELDQIQLRVSDGEPGTLRQGSRYPIQTSSFSSLSASAASIPGLTGAGSSSALSSLLASISGAVPSVPQVEYQDLGLTLKATPNVMRNGDVALNVDMKIVALSGSSINGNPILNNRAYSGIVTLKRGEAVVVASELDKSQSRAISGSPGVSEIPGLNNVSSNDNQKNYATLLIIITPHVIRGTQASGHTPMMRVERTSPAN